MLRRHQRGEAGLLRKIRADNHRWLKATAADLPPPPTYLGAGAARGCPSWSHTRRVLSLRTEQPEPSSRPASRAWKVVSTLMIMQSQASLWSRVDGLLPCPCSPGTPLSLLQPAPLLPCRRLSARASPCPHCRTPASGPPGEAPSVSASVADAEQCPLYAQTTSVQPSPVTSPGVSPAHAAGR